VGKAGGKAKEGETMKSKINWPFLLSWGPLVAAWLTLGIWMLKR
jgi:hypothetical protein